MTIVVVNRHPQTCSCIVAAAMAELRPTDKKRKVISSIKSKLDKLPDEEFPTTMDTDGFLYHLFHQGSL